MTADNPIRNVSDTALWVAVYRGTESERADAHFHDPYARRLAGERGQAIVDAMPRGHTMGWPMVVRTAVMDEIVLRCVQQGATTVLNLAAGLDARPFRLALPSSLRWLHVDSAAHAGRRSSKPFLRVPKPAGHSSFAPA